MHLFLIRHAESANNARWDGDERAFYRARDADPPLTPRGFAQVERLARHLADGGLGPIDELVTSPMRRAIETAAPVAAALGMPVRVRLDVFEQGGLFNGDPLAPETLVGDPGLGRDAMAAIAADIVVPAEAGEGWWLGEGYEDAARRRARVENVAGALLADATMRAGHRLAVITHGGFASALIAQLIGGQAYFPLHNIGITHLELGDGTRRSDVVLHSHDRVSHAGDLLTPADGTPSPPVASALRTESAG